MSSKTNDTSLGKILIFAAPSGAGKTTIVRHLLQHFPDLAFSVSATTRPAREGEVNGEDYYFLSTADFEAKIKAGDFVEWEEVYPGRFYGTLHSEVQRLWSLGKAIIFDIDVKGAGSLKKHYPESSLSVFVQPPSKQILLDRLRNRSTENEESLQVRITKAEEELSYASTFDRILVNDQLAVAFAEAEFITADFLGKPLP